MKEKESNVKKLYRSGKDNWLGGVCGGLGEYFGVDSNIIRIAWIALTIVSFGLGIILYIAAWLILPINPQHK
ncbi:MAG: PspC domain-containing protein [Candidatus Diapherotrites archaeon]